MSGYLKVCTGGLEGSLDPKRFGPKGTSVCILHEGTWMTPCEFRAKAKGNNGDSFMWKRQLRLPDLNMAMAVYIEQGHLKECDKNCQCPNCVRAATHIKEKRKSAGQNMGPLNVSVDDVMTGKAAKKAKDNDSDSGISNVSSIAAAAAAVLSKAQPLPISPKDTTPKTTNKKGRPKANLHVNTAGNLTSSDLTDKKVSALPDYTLMVREAIASVSAGMPNGCSASQGCSRLCVILYILTKYKPIEDVNVVNEKVKSTIKLLKRMGIVGKVGTDNEDDSDNEDETVYLRPVMDEMVEQTPEKKKVKQQQGFVKVTKVKKAKLLEAESADDQKVTKVKEAKLLEVDSADDPNAKVAKAAKKAKLLEVEADPEINFKPSQFYNNSIVEPPQLQCVPPVAKKGRPPKLSNCNNGQQQQQIKAKKRPAVTAKISVKNKDMAGLKKVKKALSSAKENRAKVKKVQKVKKVVQEGVDQTSLKPSCLFRTYLLSNSLAAICGHNQMTRNDAVSKLWHYIRTNQLQDPKERFTILCDDKLKAMTNRTSVNQREILTLITQHLTMIKE